MKKSRIAFLFLLIVTSGLLLCDVLHPNPPSEKHRAILQLTVSGIEANHYDPVPVNDSLSKRIYTLYLKNLDRDKMYFTQEDVDQFKPYEYKLDSSIEHGTFEFFDLVNKTLDKRTGEDSLFVDKVLSKPFDFSVNEEMNDPDKLGYAKSTEELNERWIKLLKLRTLEKLDDKLTEQEKAHEKKDTSYKDETFKEMESDSRKSLLKIYRRYFLEYSEKSDTEKFSEYCGTIASTFDPHTEYFAPIERKNFESSMSGHFYGIGAKLQINKNLDIEVEEVIPGSPTWKNGEIKAGDVFLKVAQGAGEPVDIEGMVLGKAVDLIRGKKGTEVRLTVRKKDKTIKVVSLIRDIINTEDTYAHAAVIDNGGKIGYIRLPGFYTDFDGSSSRNCYNDVKQLVKELEKENVKGIIIDLRDDGGGSLQDVVKMAGIFVPKGPVVQVKARHGEPQILNSRDTGALYRGPLLVLVNGGSASASEIFAAAMQDYKRAVIAGQQTFGKGTVQQVFSLDDNLAGSFDNLKPLGSIKITISKFYRINGGSTQWKGVTPDINIPDPAPYQYEYEKEKDGDYSIAWDKIQPAQYNTWGNTPDINYLKGESEKRIAQDSIFGLINERAAFDKVKRDSYSLNLERYRKREKELTDSVKLFDPIGKPIAFEEIATVKKGQPGDTIIPGYTGNQKKRNDFDHLIAGNGSVIIAPITMDMQKMKADTNEAKTQTNWLRGLRKDPELFEATRIINDMK